ncbi:uncharacterized protein LOC117121658 [Anneissia japonica]|uniref:uncharacterized protein LOC117121658 n=1 Tax=Anneissia japonica TaxID=1529436 RepID=UPI0014255939|nr:uncharacterized protein LOC117121658 [Anneissia japonica]XP_033122794.1 uncharacterized protein LOC117121658 [Anneissia japonica]
MGKAKQRDQPGKLKIGTSKGKGTGPTMKVFKVSNHKVVKSQQMKAKSVSTNLKRLNLQNKAQVKSNNDKFVQLQQQTAQTKKQEPHSAKPKNPIIDELTQSVNMEEAVEGFAKL